MQPSIKKYQVVKLFKDKPAELYSNNHTAEEAQSICSEYLSKVLMSKPKLDDIEYILTYQLECNKCANNNLKHN